MVGQDSILQADFQSARLRRSATSEQAD